MSSLDVDAERKHFKVSLPTGALDFIYTRVRSNELYRTRVVKIKLYRRTRHRCPFLATHS